MNILLEKLMGVDALTDELIAGDLLYSAKCAVKDYAFAVTETTAVEAETILRKQLAAAIASHEKISRYMIRKGWYPPFPIGADENLAAGAADLELAPHETMELHEVLNFKTLSLLKLKMMQGIVFDKELRNLMEKEARRSVGEVGELRAYEERTTVH